MSKCKTHEEFVMEMAIKFPNIEVLGTYINNKIKILFKCKIDGYEWYTTITNLLFNNGCPKCNLKSKGEYLIMKFLDKNKINYHLQHTFNDCKNINHLPFDCYLTNYNTCIEFQGEQHYRPVDFSGHMSKQELQEQFDNIQKRDQIKRDYCKKNKIKLLEIPYWELEDDNLEYILFDFLVKIGAIEQIA